MRDFNANEVKKDLVLWIKQWFEKNGNGCNSVVGISGGKDSSIVAALCVEALGKNRVLGVLMPNGEQKDIDFAYKVVEYLEIKSVCINIEKSYKALMEKFSASFLVTEQTVINLPARLRMATLYAVSQSNNGRVANTCNLSEDFVGYATRYGDGAGDFSPLSQLTVTEVKLIGRELGLPDEIINKTPQDGLCGKTDEDNLGFSYEILDRYIRTGVCFDDEIKNKIDYMYKKNKFKLELMDSFKYVPYDDRRKGMMW